jgi:hypothetical protein
MARLIGGWVPPSLRSTTPLFFVFFEHLRKSEKRDKLAYGTQFGKFANFTRERAKCAKNVNLHKFRKKHKFNIFTVFCKIWKILHFLNFCEKSAKFMYQCECCANWLLFHDVVITPHHDCVLTQFYFFNTHV